jgi:hypothetical protein
VRLPSRVCLLTGRSPQESGEEARDVERNLVLVLVSPLWEAQTWLASLLALKVLEVCRLPFREDFVMDLTTGKPPPQPPSSCMEDLWRIFSLQVLPGITKDILKAGWHQSTEDRCDRAWLSSMSHLRSTKGLAYRTINLHRSTISMTLPYINGVAVGSQPLVSRMCEGSFEKKPLPHKVPSVWVPTPVLDVFMHWRLTLGYAQLVRKCAFILAVLSGRRLLKLFNLKCDVSHLQISNVLVL